MNTLKDSSSSRKFKMVFNIYVKSNHITSDVIHKVKFQRFTQAVSADITVISDGTAF